MLTSPRGFGKAQAIIYSLIAIMVWVFSPTYLGLALSAISVAGILTAGHPTLLITSLLNFSLGIAFDYYLRVSEVFYFYYGNGSPPELLALVTILISCGIFYLDSINRKRWPLTINITLPKIDARLSMPLCLVIIVATFFIIATESTIFDQRFDIENLEKYPLLEYISLFIVLASLASQKSSKKIRWFTAIICTLYIAACLLTSYRMIAIISILGMSMIHLNGRTIKRKYILAAWLLSYTLLTYISYIRLGIRDIDASMILGYQNNRLDNTFTGVIETGLIYTEIAQSLQPAEIFRHLLGVLAPVPNTFIPNNFIYSISAIQNNTMPGGGVLAAFVIYFSGLLLIPYAAFFLFATKHRTTNALAGCAYLIIIMTCPRWWLYGPFVIFKYSGMLAILLGISFFYKTIIPSKNASRSKTMTINHPNRNVERN